MKLIIKVIVKFLKVLIGGILGPIDLIVTNAIPGLEDSIEIVHDVLAWLLGFVNWALSWLPFNSGIINFLILCLIFLITVPIAVDTIKLIVKWWHALAP